MVGWNSCNPCPIASLTDAGLARALPWRRPVRLLTFALRVTLLPCALLGSAPGVGQTAPGLPDVDVVLIADVQDTAGWLTLHQEVLSTSIASTKVLRTTLPARTGGSRSIDIEQPRFTVGL